MSESPSSKKYQVIFDIDSTSIGGGIFEISYTNKGEFSGLKEYFSTRKRISNGGKYSFEDFFSRTLKVFKEVGDEVYRASLVEITEVYINVGAPWMSAQKRSIHYSKKKPFTLDQTLADHLIKKELDAQFSKNIDFKNHQVVLIDRKTIDVYANGYPTRNPIGKSMTDVTIHSLTSVMSQGTHDSFQKVVENIFHRQAIMTSNTFINYEATKRFLPHTNDAILVDISGEITEVSIIQKDHLTHLGTIPVGVHHIIRSLYENLGISLEKAWGILPLVSGGHLDESTRDRYQEVLSTSFQHYLKEMYAFLDTCSREGLLPSTFILKADRSFKYWFEENFLKSDELGEVMKERNISITYLDTQINSTDEFESRDDELHIVAEYLARYGNKSDNNQEL